jgi:hypothetical protein
MLTTTEASEGLKVNNNGLKVKNQEVIEVECWDAYFLYTRNNLYNTLCCYALDNGPVEKFDQIPGRVAFRFTKYDWGKTIRQLFYEKIFTFNLNKKSQM